MLKEFLDACVRLEEAELQKPLRKTIACAEKEHDRDGKRKRQDKSKLRHGRHHGSGKRHQGKQKKKYCNYHGLCYNGTDKCNFVQARRKHVQPTHRVTEQQRLQQVLFVKDTKRWATRCSLTGKEVKDLNVFVKDKIKETNKEHNRDMHMMSDFEDLSISMSDKSIQSIISNTSAEGLNDNSRKLANKK
eukprot:5048935-Ditylum_brightwellii.AAC.1